MMIWFGTEKMTYGCFADNALAQLVEVNEEFSDADAVPGNAGLNAPLNVTFVTQSGRHSLVVGLMAVRRGAHVLNVVVD